MRCALCPFPHKLNNIPTQASPLRILAKSRKPARPTQPAFVAVMSWRSSRWKVVFPGIRASYPRLAKIRLRRQISGNTTKKKINSSISCTANPRADSPRPICKISQPNYTLSPTSESYRRRSFRASRVYISQFEFSINRGRASHTKSLR